MGDSLERLEWRYAVKKFDSDAILTKKQIDGLIRASNLTATSYGLQPIRLVVLNNKEIQNALVPHSYGQKQVAQASHVLVICIETRIDKKYITQYFERVKTIRGTSDQILTPFKNHLVKNFEEKHTEETRQWAT
ncbi:MAG: NAD(P)H-dependent oxidoreductase, partial [Flavobacteriaceae bacterium]|nr:nitroreductase family protein [Muriicola sp.]NNL39243.1 NAD(P)H-dependent oxidoreductase [Flavobacteriaceae bacterium]